MPEIERWAESGSPAMRTRIEGGRAIQQFTDGAEQKIVLQGMMRRARGVRIGRTGIVVALAAEIDVGVGRVYVREHVRRGEGKIVGGRQRIAELRRIGIGLVRIVANRAGDGNVQVVREREWILTVDQGEPDGAGMTLAATADVGGGRTHDL